MSTNVTARHGHGAVHVGGYELTDGSWAPACGTQSAATAARRPATLRPTERAVSCKKCLKANRDEEPEANRFRESLVESFQGLELSFN